MRDLAGLSRALRRGTPACSRRAPAHRGASGVGRTACLLRGGERVLGRLGARRAEARRMIPHLAVKERRERAKRAPGNAGATLARLHEQHPTAHCELDYGTPFQLLVSVILSAQTTDVG